MPIASTNTCDAASPISPSPKAVRPGRRATPTAPGRSPTTSSSTNSGNGPVDYASTDEFRLRRRRRSPPGLRRQHRTGRHPGQRRVRRATDIGGRHRTRRRRASHRYLVTVTADVGGVTATAPTACSIPARPAPGSSTVRRPTRAPRPAHRSRRGRCVSQRRVDRMCVTVGSTGRNALATYTIDVTNAGPAAATDVIVTDTLPGGVVPVGAEPSTGSCTRAGAVLTCPLGTLAVGATAEIAVTIDLLPTQPAGNVRNTVAVSSSSFDPDDTNNAAEADPECRRRRSAPGHRDTDRRPAGGRHGTVLRRLAAPRRPPTPAELAVRRSPQPARGETVTPSARSSHPGESRTDLEIGETMREAQRHQERAAARRAAIGRGGGWWSGSDSPSCACRGRLAPRYRRRSRRRPRRVRPSRLRPSRLPPNRQRSRPLRRPRRRMCPRRRPRRSRRRRPCPRHRRRSTSTSSRSARRRRTWPPELVRSGSTTTAPSRSR